MPVYILLDSSMGMAQHRVRETDGTIERTLDLARRLVRRIFEHLKVNNPMETTQLFLFSSDIEPFGEMVRDTDGILQGLVNHKRFESNAVLSQALEYIKDSINNGPKMLLYDVVVISRETVLSIAGSFQKILKQLPLPQYGRLHFLCCDFLSPTSQEELSHNFGLIQEKIAQSLRPLSALSGVCITGMTESEIDSRLSSSLKTHFIPTPLRLSCGTLSSRLTLFPTIPYSSSGEVITVHGFIPSTDIQNSRTLSKHLITPIADEISHIIKENGTCWPRNILENTEDLAEEFEQLSSRPNFIVLLKRSLTKTKNVAICTIESVALGSLTGYLQPHPTEEASPLQLYIFDGLPDWLDELSLSTLRNACELPPAKKIDPSKAVILHESILQTDIAKIFRYARRLPDRRDAVGAEIGKFIKLIRSCCFPGLGQMLLAILEREITQPETKAEYLIPIVQELRLELGL